RSQASKPPRAKSLSTALTSADERVSSRKLAKHSCATPPVRLARSMAPSKNSGAGMLHGGVVQVGPLSLIVYCQETGIVAQLVIPVPTFPPPPANSQRLPLG